ncbi:MAG: non-canonical purine NTP pyrophosphatase, partial [Clostridia bacterium]|nr:non-canonical purine NTP pyrophosphatase [Clostridia bacterium]
MKLLAATGNKHKIKEISRILSPLGYEIVSPAELGIDIDPEETGTTF